MGKRVRDCSPFTCHKQQRAAPCVLLIIASRRVDDFDVALAHTNNKTIACHADNDIIDRTSRSELNGIRPYFATNDDAAGVAQQQPIGAHQREGVSIKAHP